tara:strand:- start:180 stop:392 length:213 start_codon:yes stop_codon:yes gene_type:complete
MLVVEQLKRFIVIGATRLEIAENITLDDAVRMYSQTYPTLRNTRVYDEDGIIENNEIIYKVVSVPPKVNG